MSTFINNIQIPEDNIFCVIKPNWFGLDKTYIVYLVGRDLYFARIGGQFYDINEKHWNKYVELDISKDGFLAKDKHNFIIHENEITKVVLGRKKSWWTGEIPNNGTMVLALNNLKRKKFILHFVNEFEKVKSILEMCFKEVIIK